MQAGAIHIDLATNNRVKPETYAWTALGGSLAVAGDSQAKVLRVSNNSAGGLTFGYTIAATASGTLGAALKVTVRNGGTVSGTSLHRRNARRHRRHRSQRLQRIARASLSSSAATPYHDLCVQVRLPNGSGVTSGATSSIVLTFSATQVVS
ncbi:hypothetical protein G5V59_02905 [Nocardioides sp. W3-2-3]|uniref:hypothetical protein n=1 Tax=Nocardioides convexus TaxID=2712224 RepID=UPI0024184A7A|nr:hypothetical protein [Nocardioides convexus]NGZ99689.1 hypothetical protein [Nocardioides convexus]